VFVTKIHRPHARRIPTFLDTYRKYIYIYIHIYIHIYILCAPAFVTKIHRPHARRVPTFWDTYCNTYIYTYIYLYVNTYIYIHIFIHIFILYAPAFVTKIHRPHARRIPTFLYTYCKSPSFSGLYTESCTWCVCVCVCVCVWCGWVGGRVCVDICMFQSTHF